LVTFPARVKLRFAQQFLTNVTLEQFLTSKTSGGLRARGYSGSAVGISAD